MYVSSTKEVWRTGEIRDAWGMLCWGFKHVHPSSARGRSGGIQGRTTAHRNFTAINSSLQQGCSLICFYMGKTQLSTQSLVVAIARGIAVLQANMASVIPEFWHPKYANKWHCRVVKKRKQRSQGKYMVKRKHSSVFLIFCSFEQQNRWEMIFFLFFMLCEAFYKFRIPTFDKIQWIYERILNCWSSLY